MPFNIETARLTPTNRMRGEDAKDTKLLRAMHDEAHKYLSSFDWCKSIEESHFGLGIGGVVAVFLFRLVPAQENVDTLLWVVVGDLPPAYFVTDDCPNACSVLNAYITNMREWVDAVKNGRPLDGLIPVNVPPSVDYARQLESRLAFLSKNVIPRYSSCVEGLE